MAMFVYYARHRRSTWLETLLRLASKTLNKWQSAALGAFVGVLLGSLVFACMVA